MSVDEQVRVHSQLGHHDFVSVLEFIAALKWPVTVLLLAAIGGRWWHKSPAARATFRDWIGTRNIRLAVAGQELEATLAATQGNMITAAASDEALVATLADRAALSDDEAESQQPSSPTQGEVVNLRREAVEAVMNLAAEWGFAMARHGYPEKPDMPVQWDEQGRPEIRVPADLAEQMNKQTRQAITSARLSSLEEAVLQHMTRSQQDRRRETR